MDTVAVFGTKRTTTIRCRLGCALVNPEYDLERFVENEILHREGRGIPAKAFAMRHHRYREQESGEVSLSFSTTGLVCVLKPSEPGI